MCEPTLPFALTKTYGPIDINLRDKLKLLFLEIFFSSHAHLYVSPSHFLPFDFPFFFPFILFFYIHGSHCSMCLPLIRVRFCPEKIYLFSVQFILNELSSSHFPTSKIFVKISSLKSLATYHAENNKNIPNVSEFDETFLGH